MCFIADFHIHSHYSLATSRQLIPEYLDLWAALKGIKVIGTGDFTHPGWVGELKEKLEPAESGLFRLKKNLRLPRAIEADPDGARFLLTAEISSIYKSGPKVRKVHNLVFAPDFKTVERIQKSLQALGANITSDGRPIIGLDSRKLLELCIEASEDILFVPAHIWTPWFSMLGSKSGFDSVKECFGPLAKHIHAVETGLSTDPPMHWMCSFLDKYTLLSNSDAHSPEKLGRNANMFNCAVSYADIVSAIKAGDGKKFLGTIDMFPQEGKYHYDGHRKCAVCWNPLQTLENNETCPVCGKTVTVGVMNRIVSLSDREDINERRKRLPFYSIIPLKEMISEILGCRPATKKVAKYYDEIISRAGSEFNVLLHLSLDELQKLVDAKLLEAVRRMRERRVIVSEGFDGEFGVVKVFGEGEELSSGAMGKACAAKQRQMINFDLARYRKLNMEKTSGLL